jgi:hypothetical protein
MLDDVNNTVDDDLLAQELQFGRSNIGNFPEAPPKESLLKFLKESVVDQDDDLKQVKTANFRDEEVGRAKTTIIGFLHVAHYADSEGYDSVREYLEHKAALVAVASLGRKAKLLDTTLTVRRETRHISPSRTRTTRGMFGGEQTVVEGGDV